MKKIYLLILSSLGLSSASNAQWQNQGIDLFTLNSGSVGIGTQIPSSYVHGGNNKVLEIFNPNTVLNSQSHLVLSTGSVLNGGSAGTLTWISKNSQASKAMAYIACYQEGDATTNASGGIAFATSDGGDLTHRMYIGKNGNVGIGPGTKNLSERLSVNGTIRAVEIKVENKNWPDYVFKDDYGRPSLKEIAVQIKNTGHLPGIPSAEEVKSKGVELGDMNARLLKKIEELTLYLIDKDKELDSLKERMNKIEANNKPRILAP
ncbi:hypothetical protein SAMN06265348_103284 [Pedobacter westerhofensis]|uniref:Uncharacterized protein n=1 Tax=Pedobacter westerhofensis TaxID=425512 RepID=A0A521C7M4_9SPHI|nr:hypothetical protein [Pedobacter westerhofensis]SMO55416.1 hypothetical protein SAMN06265348_103284 [Pedobacter westerhofensis]